MNVPAVSVLTPYHKACEPYLHEAYESLRAQTFTDFEWLQMPNGGASPWAYAFDDARVRLVEPPADHGGRVGALKAACADAARGRILVELDGDDMLAPRCLERVVAAIDAGADFVYSDFAEFHDRTWRPNVYAAAYGWSHYATTAPNGAPLLAMRAPDVTPQNARAIMFAPNHVRAWSREAYDRAGGRNRDLAVADDQDLFLRMYLKGMCVERIPSCLYYYRVHAGNTVKARNAAIQKADAALYDANVEAIALKFARDAGLEAVDLCSGPRPREGFSGADVNYGGVDLEGTWPWADGTVGVFRASDALEHLSDPIHTMNEAWRCLAPGGFLLTCTPSTDGRGAFCDPTHVSFWNELSWRYYTEPRFAAYVAAFRGRFAMSRPARTFYPSQWHEDNRVPYVEAHLIALKDGYRHMGVDAWRAKL